MGLHKWKRKETVSANNDHEIGEAERKNSVTFAFIKINLIFFFFFKCYQVSSFHFMVAKKIFRVGSQTVSYCGLTKWMRIHNIHIISLDVITRVLSRTVWI